jgi:hypothetical protein
MRRKKLMRRQASDALADLTRESEKLGLHDGPQALVCVQHKRFVPCRARDGCVFSGEAADVEAVQRHQGRNEEKGHE